MKQVDSTAGQTNDEDLDFINLRKARPADFHAIREVATIARRASLGHYMTEEELSDEVDVYYSDNVLNGILNNPANAIYVAERGSKILGYCSALPKDRRGRPRL